MNLKDLIAISGEGGLFRFIAQGRNSIIVEHLETGKRQSVSSTARVSSLEDISVFGETEEIKLSEVFNRMWDKTEGGLAPDPRSGAGELEAYFSALVPEYDRGRVYNSDIKKIVQWYNLLHRLELLVREEPEEEEAPKHEADKMAAGHPETRKPHNVVEKAAPVKKGPAGASPGVKRSAPTVRKQK